MGARGKRTVIITACAVVGAILLTVLSYLLYVVCSYYRLEDRLSLEVSGDAASAVPTGSTLKLVTYNIGFGAYSDDYSFFMDGGKYSRAFSRDAVLENTAGAIALIEAEEPDFIALQEVDLDGTRSYHVDQTAIFAESFSEYDRIFAQNYDSPYFIYPFTSPIGANKSGMMTFSKYDITSAERRSLPIENSLYKLLDLDRAYSTSRIPTDNGRELVLYNVHLSAYTSDGSIADEQLKLLLQDMSAEYAKGNYVIAAGDFNKDLLGDSSQYFERDEGDFTWAKPFNTSLMPQEISIYSGSNAPTCRNADSPFRADGTDFVLSVDGMLTSANVEVLTSETIDAGFAYSDHNPVKIEFILKGE